MPFVLENEQHLLYNPPGTQLGGFHMAAKVRTKTGNRKTTIYVEFKWGGRNYYVSKNRDGVPFRDLADAHGTAAEISGQLYRARTGKGVFHPEDWTNIRPMSFTEKSKGWLEHNESRLNQGQIAPSSMREKRRMFRDYFDPHFKARDVREIRAGDIEDFIAALPSHLSAKSRKNLLIELRAFFRWLVTREEIDRVPPIPKVKYDRPQVRWMGEGDWAKVYSCIPDQYKPLFWTLRNYGLRPGEACALRWEDFDWKHGIFYIHRTFSYGEKGWQLTDRPKAGSIGILPLTEEFIAILKGLGRALSGFVFAPEGSDHFTQRQYDRIWRNACSTAGVKGLSLYQATRTSFACERVNAGVPTREIGEVMRHADPRTTEHYLSILTERKAKVIDFKRGAENSRKRENEAQ